MLFSKVSNRYMEAPAKCKVPRQNSQGVLRGKIFLKNIPRFHQLPGDDLVNVTGVIMPVGEDLVQRKIVPWMKLPKPLVRSPTSTTPTAQHDSPTKDVSAHNNNSRPDSVLQVSHTHKLISSSPINYQTNRLYVMAHE